MYNRLVWTMYKISHKHCLAKVNNLKSDLQATPAAAEYALEMFNEFLNEEERRLENL